ncbi:MAG: GAF domain-containing sensor histidine kinase [Chloroflexi bacterium]|nr:GAF domain-containing sensor histidine kinase [Chloroflexota bacterium]
METTQNTENLSQQIESFYQVSQFVESIDDIEKLLELIMGEAESAVGAEAACIALYDPSDERLRIKFASGAKRDQVKGVSLELGQGILGKSASSNSTVRADTVQKDSRFDSSVDEKTDFSTRSVLATPIRRRGVLLGVLEVINKRGELVFSDADARLLEIVAGQAAIAIDNARLLERTLQAGRLSTVGKMASSLIHDFKAPLTVIQGFVDLLGDPDMPPERRQKYSGMIQDEVAGFLTSAQALLEYARGEIRFAHEEVQFDEWLESIAEILRQSLSKAKIQLETEFECKGKVWLDREKMRRVVLNIASNAKDAMPDGGTLTISTSQDGENWRLDIHDTGTGIPVENRSKIFELFATFGKQNGTGLGLAMVDEIIQGHGGKISLESCLLGENGSLTSGTIFTISAPIARAASNNEENPVETRAETTEEVALRN